jgi:PAS domain S-box-containing protein
MSDKSFRITQSICALAAAYACVAGFVSFAGWALDVRQLTDWRNSGISIQPNAALCAGMAGASLLAIAFGFRRVSMALATIVVLISAGTILEYATGINPGLDTLFMFGREWGRVGVIVPGRMGPPGLTSWTLIGVALMLAGIGGKARAGVPALALLICCISSLSLIGYLFDASLLYTLPTITVIAFQTATFIFAMGVGLAMLVPERGLVAMLGRQDAAGMIVRRVLLPILIVPVLLGWLRLVGEREGLYDTAFGTAARTISEISLLCILLWWTAQGIARLEDFRRLDRAALEVRDRLLGTVTEHAAVGLVIISPEHRYLYSNRTYASVIGLTTHQIVGQRVADVLSNAYELQIRPRLERAFAGEAVRYELNLDDADQSSNIGGRYIDVRYEPQIENGIVKSVVVAVIDITERRRAEESLRHNEANLRDFLDNASVAMHWVGPDGIIQWVNQAELRMLGYAKEEMLEHHISKFHVDQGAIDEILVRLCKAESLQDHPARLRHKDGSIRDVLINSNVLFEDGKFIHTRCFTRDVTQQLAAERDLARHRDNLEALVRQRTIELQEAHERQRVDERLAALGTLAAGLGHDISNLMLPTQTALDVLNKLEVSPMIRDNLEAIAAAVVYLRNLSGSLRSLARDALGDSQIEQVTDVAKWWNQSEPLFKAALPRGVRLKGLIPSVADAGVGLSVAASGAQLTQMVFNLVQNAGEALTESPLIEGVVTVSAIRTDDEIAIVVADNGPGMSDEVRQRCMEPFFTTKRKALGGGMGLSLVSAIVKKLNGRVTIESSADLGTRFSIALPARLQSTLSEGGVHASPRTVAVSVSDARHRALVDWILRAHRVLTIELTAASSEAVAAHLWVVEATHIREAMTFVSRGDCLAVVIGQVDPSLEQVAHPRIILAGSATSPLAIREAIARAMAMMSELETLSECPAVLS